MLQITINEPRRQTYISEANFRSPNQEPPPYTFLYTNLSLGLTVIPIRAIHKYPLSIKPILVLFTHLNTYTS
jgi:hypothetical protein